MRDGRVSEIVPLSGADMTLPHPCWRAAELKAKARAMREAGYSYAEIAHAPGLSKGTAWNWLHEA